MEPRFETFKAACPDVDDAFLRVHLARLDERYFRSLEKEEAFSHIKGLACLTDQHPVRILLDSKRDATVSCTVLAFDYPHLFALITGVLAGHGFDIISGDVFTYRRIVEKASQSAYRRRSLRLPQQQDLTTRRRIIDRFSGAVVTSLPFETWAQRLKQDMEQVIALLHNGQEDATSQAKHRVTEMVVAQLVHLDFKASSFLSPVEIDVNNEAGPFTRLKIISADTPAFLYALTNALSLQRISIEHVRIRTIGKRVMDEIDIVDQSEKKIEDPEVLNRVRLSVLLTKQFTYFLKNSPAPYDALSRFEHLVGNVLQLPQRGRWLELLSNPHALDDLAQVLGASDFLWEDFIRSQHETFLPMLYPLLQGSRLSQPAESLPKRLSKVLKEAATPEEQQKRLNAFKDREIFLIDLDHILNPETDFRTLARRLVNLAENVVSAAARLAYDDLVCRFGKPRTAAGLEAKFAVIGLGKLGGAALGYASDIEILLVYSDNGVTDGKEVIGNAEFFDRMVRGITQYIHAKREGIFHIDLRLRPYGNDGPLACSLENFCRYYGKHGGAHSFERLALVRLRAIGGDLVLGRRIERIRDEMVYESQNIDLKELRQLREKQFKEKTLGGRLNAKFSPGGLVDLEYAIQILQVTFGKDRPELRTPRTHDALLALSRAGVLAAEEAGQLSAAYDFLRQLINAMRMVRGSAKDLFLPDMNAGEFVHLARRMGYGRTGPLAPSQRLHIDLETHMAAIRAFVDRHFGRDSLPGPATGTVADLILLDRPARKLCEAILHRAGFDDPARAYVNLRNLAGGESSRHAFARLGLLAFDIVLRTPDPDMALNNWERFIHALPSVQSHYNTLLSQPMRLEMLLKIFASSQFLADTLIRHPGFFDWIMIPQNLQQISKKPDLEEELRLASDSCTTQGEWLNKIRRFRRREILRIGTRDMCLGVGTEEIMLELSTLAEAITQVALERVLATTRDGQHGDHGQAKGPGNDFCVMAFGKLGGSELNYSSDIDLMGLQWVPQGAPAGQETSGLSNQDACAWIMERIRADLSTHTQEGYAYRVDLRLRPWGRQGCLVPSLPALISYYQDTASLWEIQAALKMRPIAGNLQIGYAFLKQIQPQLTQRRSRQDIVRSIEHMRHIAIKSTTASRVRGRDVKAGMGGLRDVEFMVQGLQLLHGPKNHHVLTANTLTALDRLRDADILPDTIATQLRQDYLFLRRVEHHLQILEDRQVHALPKAPKELAALAKRVLGIDSTATAFAQALEDAFERIRHAYTSYLLEGKD